MPDNRTQGGPPRPINADQSLATSIAVVGLFMEFLQLRFTSSETTFPFSWTSDDETTKLLILSAYDKTTKARNKRPSITVRTQGFVLRPTGIGNIMESNLKTQLTYYSVFEETTVIFTVTSEHEGTTKELADLVKMALLGCKDFLPGYCGLQDIGLPAGGMLVEAFRDTPVYETSIQIPVTYMIKWKQWVSNPILQHLTTQMELKDTSYYITLATGVTASDVWESLDEE